MRNSYDMIALNTEIDALDNKVSGKMQLELYAAVQDLLLDRLVWFLRNVDLEQGLATIVEHYRDGIAQVAAALDSALSKPAAAARAARAAELAKAGVPEALARRIASLSGAHGRARHRAGRRPHARSRSPRWPRPISPPRPSSSSTASSARRASIVVSDYFDRLALDRALDSIGDAERRLTAAMVGNGAAGAGAVEAWVKPRQAEVERIRAAIHEIAGSGLTLSKLSVAASLLGDLARE